MTHYLDILTEAQRGAVLHMDGPAIVVAAPGSGKTRTITYRVVHLIESGVNPGSIVAITFTNKAAMEMRTRITSVLPPEISKRILISTFHSMCARLIRMEAAAAGIHPNYSICDEDASKTHVIQALCQMNDLDPKEVNKLTDWQSVDYVRRYIAQQKQVLITPEQLYEEATTAGSEDEKSAYLREAYERYQSLLKKTRSLDFEDLIMQTTLLLKNNVAVRDKYARRIRYLMVDEYQDTNHSQYELALLLCSYWHNIFCVFDDDQSIYRFRGADITNILKLEEHYKDKVKAFFLQENFRSTKSIAASANAVIHHNTDRKPKQILAVSEEGEKVRCIEAEDFQQEAAFAVDEIRTMVQSGKAKYKDFAVIYRVHSRSRFYEELMVANNVPHRVIGGIGFYNRAVIKDMLAYLKLIENEYDDASFMRIYDSPPRGFGKGSYMKMYDQKEAEGESFVAAFRRERYLGVLTGRPLAGAKRLKGFFDTVTQADRTKVGPLVELVLKASEYKKYLVTTGNEDQIAKADNLDSFLDAAYEFDRSHGAGLTRFLEWTSLLQAGDETEEDDNKVSLMTCHAAKGLEFKYVYLIGAIEGLMPIIRPENDDGSLKSDEEMRQDLQEERRVFYVGMTRAEKGLAVSYSRKRFMRGEILQCYPSRFVGEMGDTVDLIPIADAPAIGSLVMSKLEQHKQRRANVPRYASKKTYGSRAGSRSYKTRYR